MWVLEVAMRRRPRTLLTIQHRWEKKQYGNGQLCKIDRMTGKHAYKCLRTHQSHSSAVSPKVP